MTSQGRRLAAALADLREIKQTIADHPHPDFAARFAELRAWQSEHVAHFHHERAIAHGGEDLLVFLTQRFYVEADWSELLAGPERLLAGWSRAYPSPDPMNPTEWG